MGLEIFVALFDDFVLHRYVRRRNRAAEFEYEGLEPQDL